MSVFDELMCKHDYKDEGMYRKLKCVKCGKEIFYKIEVKS
jgi:DNA-directed RNA polymerase subunit RPC12/RpoP